MEITLLDFILINIITYGVGITSGIIIFNKCKNYHNPNEIQMNTNLNNPIITAQPSAPNISEIVLKT